MHVTRWFLVSVSMVAVTTTAWAGIQANGIQANGIQANGIQANGVYVNGIQANGIQANGIQANGIQANGIQANGVQISGTEITASYIGSGNAAFPYSCAHREDVVGGVLNNCSPCAQVVGDADAYCRYNSWDSICVSEARTMCRASLTVGTVFPTTNASLPSIVMTARNRVGWFYDGAQWVDHSDVWYNTLNWTLPHAPNVQGAPMPFSTPSQCVRAVVAEDPYCGQYSWDALCVEGANRLCTSGVKAQQRTVAHGDSICGYDANGFAIQGLFIQGTWDTRAGVQGGGAKIPSASNGDFSIACRGVGAIAKCVDMGYRPWRSAADDTLHQSCVRAVRDDLCGDGTSWTENGHQINLYDYRGTQTDGASWSFDAVWTPDGARYIAWWGGGRVGGTTNWSSDLADYKATHPFCQTEAYHPYSSPVGATTLDGQPNQIKTERVYTCTSTMCQ